jgi:hypothetical protein
MIQMERGSALRDDTDGGGGGRRGGADQTTCVSCSKTEFHLG